jgi:hypothetical protein
MIFGSAPKLSPPHSVAQHRHPRPIPFALVCAKLPAELRLHTQQRKEILRHWNARESFRFAVSDQFGVAHAVKRHVCRHVFEGLVLRPQVQEVIDLRGHSRQISGSILMIRDPRQPCRIPEWQRADQQRVHHAENRAARARIPSIPMIAYCREGKNPASRRKVRTRVPQVLSQASSNNGSPALFYGAYSSQSFLSSHNAKSPPAALPVGFIPAFSFSAASRST